MTTTADNEHARTTEEAVDWFISNRVGSAPDAAGRRRFRDWLEDSPQHVEEYLAVTQLAGDLTQAAQPDVPLEVLIARARADRDEAATEDRVLPFPGRACSAQLRAGRPRWLPAALAAGLCALAAGLGWWQFGRVADSGAAGLPLAALHGQQLTHEMEDGSVLRLNTDTAARVLYSAGRREVVLEHGQALFEVEPDTARPFAVIAGTIEVVAVGTAFEVYLKGDVTQITVTKGRVRVGATGTGAGFEPVFVRDGEQLSVREGSRPLAPVKVNAAAETSWINRFIVFTRRPLIDVAAEFNRYSPKPMQIATPGLESLPITVGFSLDDLNGLVKYLEDREELRVERGSERIVVTGG